jgi:hypothetical protein
MVGPRLPFELDDAIEESGITAHAGVPLLIEAFRVSGSASALDDAVKVKQRARGLTVSEMVESLFALWAVGGERCDDLESLREDAALATLIGHGFPAPQTARDFLEAFDQPALPLWQGEVARVPGEGERLQGLARTNRHLLAYFQERLPQATATLDIDATVLESRKRTAWRAYDGRTGYHPAIAVWAERDVIVHDEFRDGNVPAGSGTLRLVQAAVAALPPGIEQVLVRGDSALYDAKTLRWMEDEGYGYGISADMTRPLAATIEALPEKAWAAADEEDGALRHWAEVVYVPTNRRADKDGPPPPRYLVMRITKKQGALFADGSEARHYAIVTNRADPPGGSGLDLIRWQRGKAGTVEHAHHVLTNELAAEALPSAKFAANAAWFRLNVLLYNLLSVFKRIALPEELHNARPKRLRFVLLNGIGKVVRHARETLLRLTSAARRSLADRARVQLAAGLLPKIPKPLAA